MEVLFAQQLTEENIMGGGVSVAQEGFIELVEGEVIIAQEEIITAEMWNEEGTVESGDGEMEFTDAT